MTFRNFHRWTGLLSLLILANSATAQPGTVQNQAVRQRPAHIILKLDDLVKTGTGVSPRWKKLAEFIRQRQIKVSIGIICNSLEGNNPEYEQWIKDQQATGLFEFWNHGYTHKGWKVDGKDVQEFNGPTYEEQLANLAKSETLAREKLGFSFAAFGAPFNAADMNTSKALQDTPGIRVWLYGNARNPGGKLVLNRIGEVNIENPLFVPSLEKFVAGYNKYPNQDYFVIQGHANQWDDERFDQFTKIVDFLTAQKAVFTTPSEYASLIKDVIANPPAIAQPMKTQPVIAQPAPNAPQSLVSNGDFSGPLEGTWSLGGKTAPKSKIVDVKIPGTTFSRALQLDLAANAGTVPWDARLAAPRTVPPVAKNDVILLQFWARSTLRSGLYAVYQESNASHTKLIYQHVTVQPEWQQFTFYAPAKSAYGAGGSNFELQMGLTRGQLELTGISVQNLGTQPLAEINKRFGPETIDYYGGETPNDDWLPAAQARIEKFRKADLKLRVLDATGKPVPDAKVSLKQTKSAFRWGTAVNYNLLGTGPDADTYRATLKRLFNTAVLENDLKWRMSDGNPAIVARAADSLTWLAANGFAVRGHTLVWGSDRYMPERLKDTAADELRAAVEARVTDAVTLNKGKVYVWDVVNEAGTNTQLWDKIGWPAFSETYRRARTADPNVLLAYNDYNISNEAPDKGALRRRVEARIQTLIDSGAPLDVLGDQAHMGTPLTPIPRVLQIWDDWGQKFGKPIEITEFDANIANDTIHEKYVRDYLTAAFSNPNIQSFLMWGFWAKAHFLGAPGALFRADWTPRPTALTYEDLVLRQWRTNQTIAADKTGSATTRAFLGDYEVQVTGAGKSATVVLSVGKAGLEQDIVLR